MNGTLQAKFDHSFIRIAVLPLTRVTKNRAMSSLFKHYNTGRAKKKLKIEAIVDTTAAFLHVS